MTDADVVKIAMMTAVVCVKLAGPVLIVSLVIGVVVSIFQAIFQVNDQSLAMVPKLVGIAATIVFTAAWSLKVLIEFTQELMRMLPDLLR